MSTFFNGGTNWEVFWVVFTEFIDIFLYMFSLYLMYPQDEMSRDELSQLLPQNRLWKLLIIKIRKFPPFFHFSIIGLPPVSSSTLGSPHPFIHLSIQVVGNDFCWPNFIRGIFLKSTAPQWGETFHSKWEKTKEPTETGDPHYCRYDGLWPSFTKTMAYLRYLEIHSWSSCFVSGQVNDLVMTFLPHQSHQSLFVTYKAWYQLKPWPWTN